MRRVLLSGVMAMVIMGAQLGTMFFLSEEEPLGCCLYDSESGCCRTMTETGNVCKDAAGVAMKSGEMNQPACGSAPQEPEFDMSEWEGFPPTPVQAIPVPPFGEFSFLSFLHPYHRSLLEPLDPPPRLS
jgi:hypothetical protein